MKNEKLQCGYEHECKTKSCLKCKKRVWIRFRLADIPISLAEAIVIEDFATVDLEQWIKDEKKYGKNTLELSQNVMRKTFKRIKWEKKKKYSFI